MRLLGFVLCCAALCVHVGADAQDAREDDRRPVRATDFVDPLSMPAPAGAAASEAPAAPAAPSEPPGPTSASSEGASVVIEVGLGLVPLGELQAETGSDSVTDDLTPGWQVDAALRFPMGRYVELGGQVAVGSFTSETWRERGDPAAVALDVGVVALVGVPLGAVTPYLRVPLGLSFAFLSKRQFEPDANSVSADGGVHFGAGLGASLAVADDLLAFADVDLLIRDTSHTVDVSTFGGARFEADYGLSTTLLVIRAGAALSL